MDKSRVVFAVLGRQVLVIRLNAVRFADDSDQLPDERRASLGVRKNLMEKNGVFQNRAARLPDIKRSRDPKAQSAGGSQASEPTYGVRERDGRRLNSPYGSESIAKYRNVPKG